MISYVCADCQRISPTHPRCKECQAKREHFRYVSRPHRMGTYKARARKVRESASVCWICGEGARPEDPWTADHLVPGDPNSPLLPAHRSCNSRRGDRPVVGMAR